ncbi:probable LRR receptor-like serine/threonine-protein kinase At5g59680 [Brassica napus]|uniref:probable LRR receptor-like serine/threonine-protein kinase At5g59680 n=1 Tax=Brassica napus TaxID=3708 RepID=UPI0020792C82|nr:probable LRR receptor-like serine/threonine-protein kinase At5g59680 [Brassica napus]
MEIFLSLLLVLGVIHLVQAQSQRGFISLDCGLPANEPSPYSESNYTGLHFSSDSKFIQTGEIGRIQTNLENPLKPYTTLRYFPEGTRNCYNLPVDKGRKYLIKAWFRYGNYDGHDIKPMFDLYIGPNLWATVDMQNLDGNSTSEEILHVPTSDSLQICLVKNEGTTPFISSLELRPLGNNSYITQFGSLKLFRRRYYTTSDDFIRYPDDTYDRQWFPRSLSWLTHISTTSGVSDGQSYNLPKAVRQSAATPTNASLPLTISWTPENPNDQFYMYLHFAEIQDLQANETREFAVFLDGNRFADPVIPKKFEITTIASQIPLTCEGEECNLQLTRTRRSTLPPLLNAYEIYKVMQFTQPETDETEVVALKSIQDTYKLIRINWQGDPCVPQHLMWDGLTCSISPRVTSLNLSSIGLTGTIAAAIQNLTQLEKLDLSNNKLTGELPDFLGNIKPLLFINLSGNDLNGSIPQSLQNKGIELLLHGNPRLCQTKSCTKPHSKDFPVVIVATAASVIILVAVLVLVFVLVFRKKNQYTAMQAQQMPPSMPAVVNIANANSHEPLNEIKRRMFTYSEVIKMTNNFQNSLGKGGFGMVYHGFVNGSKQVAVKVLSQSSTQGYKEFKAEVDLLLRVHHTNLVTLVGYCYEGDHLALIYEFLPNGDLKQHLTGKGGRPIINWSTRLGIALEAALGLEYLHIGCTPPMVHRDVKTANILLDDNFKAKLADFGLSRSFQGGIESRDFTAIAGTPGYLDPEYNHLGRLGEKSDVYSFGIVLLEMITNQPVISQTSENSHITKWVSSKLICGDIIEIMDPNLRKDYDSNSAWRAVELAMSCANPSYSKRPSMSQVINELKECIMCENSRLSNNQNLESQAINIGLDSSVVPKAR